MSSFVDYRDGCSLFPRIAGLCFLKTCCFPTLPCKISQIDCEAVICFLEFITYRWTCICLSPHIQVLRHKTTTTAPLTVMSYSHIRPLEWLLRVLCVTTWSPGYFYKNTGLRWSQVTWLNHLCQTVTSWTFVDLFHTGNVLERQPRVVSASYVFEFLPEICLLQALVAIFCHAFDLEVQYSQVNKMGIFWCSSIWCCGREPVKRDWSFVHRFDSWLHTQCFLVVLLYSQASQTINKHWQLSLTDANTLFTLCRNSDLSAASSLLCLYAGYVQLLYKCLGSIFLAELTAKYTLIEIFHTSESCLKIRSCLLVVFVVRRKAGYWFSAYRYRLSH